MNLFELFVKIGVDDKASGKIKTLTKNLGSGLKSAAEIGTKAVIGLTTTAAAGIATLTGMAVKNYAEYEQLAGGVETLFKGSADAVMKNASEAYRTSAMSANDYMEVVTSFSASLIQSLEGDTEAAAQKADVAIRDMSDNANKFGSDIETLKTAYAGFAKGQFMLLDNLKLGYGGTQAEMKRLLEDAEAISGIEYDISSYADIVDAIHIIQEEMSVAGATALEASTTIEGSLNMMKASWENLLTGVADENADFDQLMENFVDSVGTVYDNLAPRIEIALDGVTKMIDTLLPKVVDEIPKLINKFLPKLAKSAVKIIKTFADSIKKNSKSLVRTAKNVVMTLVDGLLDSLPDLIDGASELFNGIISAIPDVVIKIVKEMPKIVAAIVKGLVSGIGAVAKAVADLFNPTTWTLSEMKEGIREAAQNVTPFTDAVNSAKDSVVDLSNVMSEKGRTISEIDDEIAEVEGNITEIIKREFEEQDGYRQEDLDSIKKYNDQLKALAIEKQNIYRQQMIAEYNKILLDTELDEGNVAQYISTLNTNLEKANEETEKWYTSALTQIENQYSAIGAVGSKEYIAAQEAVKSQYEEMLAETQTAYQKGATYLRVQSGSISGFSLSGYTSEAKEFLEVAKEGYPVIKKFKDYVEQDYNFAFPDFSILATGPQVAQYADNIKLQFTEALQAIDIEATNTYLSMQSLLRDEDGYLSGAAAENVSSLLAIFDYVPPALEDTAHEAITAMASGLEEQIPELGNAANMTSSEIADVLRKNLIDPNGEYNLKNLMGTAANQAADGFENGFEERISSIMSTVKGIAAGVINAMNKAFEIKSPSRKTKKMAYFLAEGFAVGFKNFGNLAFDAAGEFSDGVLDYLEPEYGVEYDVGTDYSTPYNGSTLTDAVAESVMITGNQRRNQKVVVELSLKDSDSELGRALLNALTTTQREVFA